MLTVNEHGTLFGFHEPGYDPTAISRSRVAEIVAAVLLTVSLALRVRATHDRVGEPTRLRPPINRRSAACVTRRDIP